LQVPLDKILVRLQQHVDTIRADLIDVINADYPLFIQMAEKLKGVEGSALQIQTPLLKLKESLSELQGRYQDELESLKECLERQSQVVVLCY
jgi:COG (conserved oligomeric Golgi) complex component, COG2